MLDNATSINSAAQELANNVSMVTDQVDQLEQTVREDKEAITTATDTAIESIAVATNLTEQIVTIQVKIKHWPSDACMRASCSSAMIIANL